MITRITWRSNKEYLSMYAGYVRVGIVKFNPDKNVHYWRMLLDELEFGSAITEHRAKILCEKAFRHWVNQATLAILEQGDVIRNSVQRQERAYIPDGEEADG